MATRGEPPSGVVPVIERGGADAFPDAAFDRVDRFLVEVSKRPVEEWPVHAVRPAHPEPHRDALAAAHRAVHDAGLNDALASLLGSIEDWVLERYAFRAYDPTFIGLNWNRSPGTARDRAAVAESLRDAVTALALGDLLPPQAAEELVAGWAWAVRSRRAGGRPRPPSRSGRRSLDPGD
jgi:hypothetical protein